MPDHLPDLVTTADHGRTAVVAHGAGSSADFVVRAFGAPLAAAGLRLVTWDRRSAAAHWQAEYDAVVEATGAAVVGGVSVGALLAARCALRVSGRLAGLLVVLPPWTGAPGPTGALTASSARTVAAVGTASAVDGARAGAVPWVAAELGRAWPAFGDAALVAELRAAADTPGPTSAELAACTVPCGLVALDPDPLHPLDVAREWARALPHAVLETVPVAAPADGVRVLGDAAVRAWRRAVSASR